MSIIGISGKINSGKDTVAEIIQYLLFRTNKHEVGLDNSFEEFRKVINKEWSKEEITIETSFEIKKFADKLKDIVCMLIGCTREQLEDRVFKEKELGEEWWYWHMKRNNGYKDIILDYLSTTKEELNNYDGLVLIKPTPRLLLQHIGTDLFRNKLHPNIWVNALMVDYKESQLGQAKRRRKGKSFPVGYFLPNWIITDVRFPNELEAIKNKGGIVIRVNREISKEEDVNQSLLGAMSNYKEHPSETALDNYQNFDYIIENDGTMKDLVEKVENVMKNIAILQ